jgi:hypothetical protein
MQGLQSLLTDEAAIVQLPIDEMYMASKGVYMASWLTRVDTFVSVSKRLFHGMDNLTRWAARHGNCEAAGYPNDHWNTVCTVDMLGFANIHMSMHARLLEMNAEQLLTLLPDYMSQKQRQLKEFEALARKGRDKPLSPSVVIIPFAAAVGGGHSTSLLKVIDLNLTVASNLIYFSHVAVMVSNEVDQKIVEDAGIPVWKIVRIKLTTGAKPCSLPLLGLNHIWQLFEESPEWKQFRWIYFTEGDQLTFAKQSTVEKIAKDSLSNKIGTPVRSDAALLVVPYC